MTVDLINNELALICPDPIIGVDRSGIITLFNPAAERLLGYDRTEMVGRYPIIDLYPSLEQAREIKRLRYREKSGPIGQLIDYKTELKCKQGKLIPIQLSACLIEEQGEEIGSVGFFHDLTAQLALEESLKLISVTDSLTGLFNQRHFHTVLNQEIERSLRYEHHLSLICIDLDRFKSVNDVLGHVEGDNALRYVGESIKQVLRSSDYGFRYGGDEFMLILPETKRENALSVSHRLLDYFEQHRPSTLIEHAQSSEPVTLSIGIAEYRKDEGASLFVKRADLAMYEAKKQSGSVTSAA